MTQEITRTEHSAPTRQFTVLLSPTRRGARLARLLATAHLGDWGLPSESAAHIVAELATNATVHGRVRGRDFQLSLIVHRDALLRIEVTDTRGEQLPPTPGTTSAPADDAESGRGLLIVEALADRWGIDLGPVPRKTIWAELGLAP
ncbi:ATP-binding protein [Streptomyces sp. NBC_01221]|uniref:ATP-binding protein n=1 Tax=unclassified Streptomyces TaxID=2593676 RepID=UPI002256F28F|nr:MULTISPECIES: ATP-binding protein [unclassified Streptomyces]MCX4787132.1 ATP-binding protein [Streptomyces sp. NBC_01221]MCX4797085.1 ATP-binding protein [Streptomyces sp. NBC_01242]WSJ38386.1 ATP-binding protein [Streptomyces sp. NBC_01321]WSP55450.1 ATP-binding protein [Streptomyces sp. NBC_01241]